MVTAAAEVGGEGWNRGRYSPNLLSIPANVATASLYPPRWSGLGAGSVILDLGTGSDPAGFLEMRRENGTRCEEKKKRLKPASSQ